MANTIVAIYRDDGNAQSAADELKRNGFPIENLRFDHDDRSHDQRQRSSRDVPHGNRGMMEFFTSLIEKKAGRDDVTNAQMEAMREGNSFIVVRTENGQQADQATDIINRHHPIAVDEHWTQ